MKEFRVAPGSKVNLSRWDPSDTSAFPGVTKETHAALLEETRAEMRTLHGKLIASRSHKVLVVLQAMDAGGKDGTVRSAFFGLNPGGLSVAAFKPPTPHELDHDFLWRVHKCVPARGQLVIFNRSHYEDIVAVKIKKLAPREVWERRFDHIVNFEKLLSDEGTVILKFYLHIDQAEQKERLKDRLIQQSKHWKIDPSDIEDCRMWEEFADVYENVMQKTSTDFAPWFIVPSNKKWFRNLVVATIVRDTLAGLKMDFPALHPSLAGMTEV